MEELAKLLGLGPPMIAAGAIYWLFSFLDKKASDELNQALTSWMKGANYNRIDLGEAVISAFDHLYGAKLFSWRAFRRSALLSLCAVLIYCLFIAWSNWIRPQGLPEAEGLIFGLIFEIGFDVLILTPGIVIEDYLSLYVIRQYLRLATKSVFLSVLIALIFGFLAVSATGVFIIVVFQWLTMPGINLFYMSYGLFGRTVLQMALPAFLVHLWLPLFLIGASLNTGLRVFFRAVGLAQRFIKHGDEHPFDAIGLVAAAFVFVVATLWQIGSHFI